MDIQNILVPTDLSSCAKNAAEIAITLAKKTKAEIHFLHIPNTPVEWKRLRKEQEKNFPETLKRIGHARAELDKLEKKAKDARVKAKQIMEFDRSSDEILAYAKRKKIDLIVMGSHGASGVQKVIMGSTAQRVVRTSTAPVLVVKDKPKRFDVKNIAYASEFGKNTNKAFDQTMDFAKTMRSALHLVYVNTPASFEESAVTTKRLEQYMKKCPRGCTANIENAFTVESGVLNFAGDNKCDMIALSTEGRSGVMQLFSHSVTEDIVNQSKIPVLVFKGAK